jgi:hypothetical protein
MNIGYNDMNTYAPQPFVTPGPIVISGGARPKQPAKADYKILPYTRPAVMPSPEFIERMERERPPLRLYGAGNNDVEKAMKQLKSFMNGTRKTKPAKKMLDILEKEGIISKMTGGYKSTSKEQIEDADAWTDYAVRTGDKGIGLARRGYENAKDAMNPAQSEAKKAAKQVSKWFGGEKPKKSPSQWIMFVKDFAQKNNIPYKEALKLASPHYKKLKGSGYSSVN